MTANWWTTARGSHSVTRLVTTERLTCVGGDITAVDNGILAVESKLMSAAIECNYCHYPLWLGG